MDSLKGWEQRLEVWFGKYFLNSQRGPQHCIFLSSLIEKYQNKELDRFVSFLWVPVEKKNSFSFTQFEVTAILRLFTETSVWYWRRLFGKDDGVPEFVVRNALTFPAWWNQNQEARWIDIVDMVCSHWPLNCFWLFYKTQEVVFLVFVSPYFL